VLDILPTEEELVKAASQLASGKVKNAAQTASQRDLQERWSSPRQPCPPVIQGHLVTGDSPSVQDFKDATIIHLYKRKGNRQDCNNHLGISLQSIARKLLARILLNRLMKHLEQNLLLESQCGFRKDRGILDIVFAARQLQEKWNEMKWNEIYL